MKNFLSKALVVVAVAATTAQVQAYSYQFTNLTKNLIGVGMRYAGLGEPRYFRWIAPNEARQFTPKAATRSNERQIEGRKIGFVAKTWWYVQNPDANKMNNAPKELPWQEFEITWMPSKSFELAKKLGKAVTDFSMAAGQVVVDVALAAAAAAAAPETGGASLAAIKAGQSVDKAALFNTLGKVIKATGSLAARSMMTDRQITIIDTPEGIKFISQL
jgi:hypothetical protein